MPSLPRVEKLDNGAHQFILNDRPFLILGGELNNSSFSSVQYMREQTEKLKASNLNTILGSVSWEQIEPVEGAFDFAEFDKCVEWARDAGFRVVLLWFAAFKNGMSTYAPHWVKRDTKRFPRVRITKPKPESIDGDCASTLSNSSQSKTKIHDVISLFGDELLDADARAFKTLMSHVKEIDGEHQTVIMVQVENEPGILADSRDRSSLANAAFARPPPVELVSWLHANASALSPALTTMLSLPPGPKATWEETFGVSRRTDELFMAYHYAKYHDAIAAAGSSVYDIPYYVNVWVLDIESEDKAASEEGATISAPGDEDVVRADGGATPGDYPSGGAVSHMLPLWQRFTPNIALIAPDIYGKDYLALCDIYGPKWGGALFIPEQRRNLEGALWSWGAIGTYGALGVSPFAIDTTPPDENVYAGHYALLGKMAPWILRARRDGQKTFGFHFDRFEQGQTDPGPKTHEVIMGEWKLSISRAAIFGHPSPGYGIIIQLEGDKFLLIGEGYQVNFSSTHPKAAFNSLLAFDEVDVDERTGELVKQRMLNGDETTSGPHASVARMPWSAPDYAGFFICINIPSRTKIAIAQPYFLEEDDDAE